LTEQAVQPKSTASQKAQYLEIIKQHETEFAPWHEQGRNINKRYMDDRNARQTNRRRFNILWSNVQTLLPALYYQPPKPNVERRYRDKDPVGRLTADVLERGCTYFINDCDFSASVEQAVLDRLLSGRGVIWLRYVPHFKDAEVQGLPEEQSDGYEVSDDAEPPPVPQEIEYEEVCTDYVHYEDFGHNVCRTWAEVTTVWRKVYLTRDELIARFGDDIGARVPLDHKPQDMKSARELDDGKKATIYELWDKGKKQAVWLHKDYADLLDVKDDPLRLKRFFPCPEPLYTTRSNNSLVPSPDYKQYQDQAGELDELTARIYSLTKAIKMAGVYDSSAPALANLLSEGVENRLIPVDTWAAFSEKGGLKGAVDFMPLKDVVEALLALHESRDKVKDVLYEITGMSDIMRGASDPDETAKAQQIKGQYGSMRLGKMQQAVSRFIRDGVQIMAEIMAEHFSQTTLAMITGVDLFTDAEKQQIQIQQQQAQMIAQHQAMMQVQQQNVPGAQGAGAMASPPSQQGASPPAPPQIPPDVAKKLKQPSWDDVEKLLRNNAVMHFRIGIETDSTIKADQEADKSARIEATTALGQFLEQAAMAPPEMQPLLGEALLFLTRGFKSARGLESAVEDFISNMQENPPQPKQGGDPEQTKLQIAQMNNDAKNKQLMAKTQADMQMKAADKQAEIQRESIEDQTWMVNEREKMDAQKQIAWLKENHENGRAALEAKMDLILTHINNQHAQKLQDSKPVPKAQGH
jgi:hypothetical protein